MSRQSPRITTICSINATQDHTIQCNAVLSPFLRLPDAIFVRWQRNLLGNHDLYCYHYILARWALVDVSRASATELSVYLSDHSALPFQREWETTCKNTAIIIEFFSFAIFRVNTILWHHIYTDDGDMICPLVLFIWRWADINCGPNLCYSSKQSLLPTPDI